MRRHLGALQLAAVLGDALVQGAQVPFGVHEALALALIEFFSARAAGLHQHGFGGGEHTVAPALKALEKIVVRGATSHDGASFGSGGAETVDPNDKATVSAHDKGSRVDDSTWGHPSPRAAVSASDR